MRLDGVTMRVSSTASNGVVDAATRLVFRQHGQRVVGWNTRDGGGTNAFEQVPGD